MSDSSCRGSEIATVPGSDERPGSALVQTLVQRPGLAKRQGFPYHIHPTTSQPELPLAHPGQFGISAGWRNTPGVAPPALGSAAGGLKAPPSSCQCRATKSDAKNTAGFPDLILIEMKKSRAALWNFSPTPT